MKALRSSVARSFLVRHRWKVSWISSFLLTASTAVLVLTLHVPQYEASALIQIEESVPFLAFERGKVSRPQGSDRNILTQVELIRSQVVLNPVINRLEIVRLPEFRGKVDVCEYLLKRLTIMQVGASELYQIQYVGPSAKDAASIVNAVLKEYLQIQSVYDYRQSQRVIDLLEEERMRRSLNVERLRERVLKLAKEVTGEDPFGNGVPHGSGSNLDAKLDLYLDMIGTDIAVEQSVLKAEIQSLCETPVQHSGHQLSHLPSVDMSQEREQEIAKLQRQLAGLDVKKKIIADRYVQQMKELKMDDPKRVQLEFCRAELEREEKVFELIAARKLALQTELRAPTRVQMRQVADVPIKPIDPVPYKMLFISCLAVFPIPFALAFVFRAAQKVSPKQKNPESLRKFKQGEWWGNSRANS